MLYKTHLEKHHKSLFNLLLIKGKLYQNCAEVESQAKEMYDLLIQQMKSSEGITEKLKEYNQWEWIQKISNIQARANSIVYQEIISI